MHLFPAPIEVVERNTGEEFLLYEGPRNFVNFVLPAGEYSVYAEIHESGGTFA
jgi:hypothetical protein